MTEPVITAKDLNLWYGDFKALKNISLDVGEKEITALIGPSGCGKSTFLKTLNRMNDLVPGVRIEGDVRLKGQDIFAREMELTDLRRISTAMKVVTDLERIGDHASDIAEIIPHLVTVRKEGDPAVSQAIRMGQKAHRMILDALAALTGEDEGAARNVIATDDEVDYDFNAIKHTLAQEIAAVPAKVDAALDLLMVIKYLERIGDHAVNVAEWVQFVRTGRYKDESMF